MFNTHLALIPMSFFPAGLSCGFLGLTPDGLLLTAVLLSLFWIHIGFFFASKLFLDMDVGQFPTKELIIAAVCFVAGYAISLGHENFHSSMIALLVCGAFFIHDFFFGISSLFSGNTLRSIIDNIPPIRRPKNKEFFTPAEEIKPNIPVSSVPHIENESQWLKDFQEEITKNAQELENNGTRKD